MERRKRAGRKVISKDFAERLRTLRRDRSLSQRQLAELVGCETMLISRYERGAAIPRLDSLVSLAEALRVSTDEIAVGRKPVDIGDQPPIRNVLLLERFRDLETLPKEDQVVAMKLLDALIAARSVETAMTRARRTA